MINKALIADKENFCFIQTKIYQIANVEARLDTPRVCICCKFYLKNAVNLNKINVILIRGLRTIYLKFIKIIYTERWVKKEF